MYKLFHKQYLTYLPHVMKFVTQLNKIEYWGLKASAGLKYKPRVCIILQKGANYPRSEITPLNEGEQR